VNSLTATIAGLNGQISQLSPNADAGTLEDQRQAAIAQLSQYVGLNQITTERNEITLTTSGGAVLVSGNSSYALATTQVSGTTHVVDSSGQDITGRISGGQLGGVLPVRDTEIPAVSSALDQMAWGIGSSVNAVNVQGLDGNGTPGGILFAVAGGIVGSAATLTVVTSDPEKIAAAAIGEGSAGNTNAQNMADLSTGNIVGGTATASSFYASLLAQVGNAAASATADSTQQQATLTQLSTQRDQLSGVSLDEEAANLTQYQRSYQAAAKVFSIVDSLMATVINLGVQTAVS
jgi:flagellar hook-associated protein 1 FlgK